MEACFENLYGAKFDVLVGMISAVDKSFMNQRLNN